MPNGWVCCPLKVICDVRGGKRIPAGEKFSITVTSHKYLRVTDMKNNSIKSCAYITDEIFEKIKNYTINHNDIYITVAGTIGDVGIIPIEYDGANLTENADKLLLNNNIYKNWFVLYLQSDYCQKQIKDVTTKVGQPKLAIKRIEDLSVIIPPFITQIAIHQKITSLFDYIKN